MSADAGISKAVTLLVAILTVISLIAGGVFWIVHQNDMLAAGQALNTQAIRNNTDAIKSLNEKRQQGDENFDKLIRIMSKMHGGRGN